MSNANYEMGTITELNLSNQHATTLPPTKCLELFSNLQILILNDNCLSKFDASIITRNFPQLIALDFQNNKIENLDDIIDLGSLQHLQILEIAGNPFCSFMKWLNILTELLYPSKLQPYDPVKILTADYHAVPNPSCYSKEQDQPSSNLKTNQKFNTDIAASIVRVRSKNKSNNLCSLPKNYALPCPVPRRSRFPNLKVLNSVVITVFDMVRASGKDDIKEIVIDKNELKTQEYQNESSGYSNIIQIPTGLPEYTIKWLQKKNEQIQKQIQDQVSKSIKHCYTNHMKNNKIIRENEDKHQYYLNSYKSKIDRLIQTNKDTVVSIQKQDNEDELDYLRRVDQQERKLVKKQINPKKFAAELWEVPTDVLYKNAEYNVSMQEHYQQCKQYQEELKQKQAKQNSAKKKRQAQNREIIRKRLNEEGIGIPGDYEEGSESIESDFEIKKIFKSKAKEIKPKMNLLNQQEDSFQSSASSAQESISNSSINNKSQLSEGESEVENRLSQSSAQQPQLQSQYQQAAPEELNDKSITDEHGKLPDTQNLLQSNQNTQRTDIHKQNKDAYIKKENDINAIMQKLQNQDKVSQDKNHKKLEQYKKQKEFQSQKKKQEVFERKQKVQLKLQQQQLEEDLLIKNSESSKLDTKTTERKEQKSSAKNQEAGELTDSRQLTSKHPISTDYTCTDASKKMERYKTEQGTEKQINTEGDIRIQNQLFTQMNNTSDIGGGDNNTKIIQNLGTNTEFQEVEEPANNQQLLEKIQILPITKFDFNQIQFSEKQKKSHAQEIKQEIVSTFSLKNKLFFSNSKQNHTEATQSSGNYLSSQRPQTMLSHKTKEEEKKIDKSTKSMAQSISQPQFQIKKHGPMYSSITGLKEIETNRAQEKQLLESKSILNSQFGKKNTLLTGMVPESNTQADDEVSKCDVPLEDLVGNELIGLEEKYRTQFLYDPKCDKYVQLKNYKTILDQALTLKKQRDHYEKVNNLTNPTKKVLEFYKEAIPLNKIIEYLKTDPQFEIQKTSDPADQIEYSITRKIKDGNGQQASKLSTFDLREIIYRANGYDTKTEPKISEKEIREVLERKDIDFETKKKFYDWLDILEDISLKSKKNNDVMLARAEEKEIKRAEANSHLAYHYKKLRKHLPQDVYEKHMRELNLADEDIEKIKFKKPVQENTIVNQIEQQYQIRVDDNRLYSIYKRNTQKQEYDQYKGQTYVPETYDSTNQLSNNSQIKGQKQGFSSEARVLTQVKSDSRYPRKRQVNLGGYLVEDIPNINEKINAKLNKYEKYPKLTFEDMVDQNMRKLQEQEHKNKQGDLDTKEQIQRYANEFKEKVKKREQLKQNIDKYIQENQKKLEEFWEYEREANKRRHDKDQCFKDYVKLVREGKIV